MHPSDAIAAASHADPYPYYRQMLAGPSLYFDAVLRLWIASRAAVIEEVFDNPCCLVRPSGEPVPRAIAGSAAGAVFGRLMRMNEGAAHARPRQAIGHALAALDPAAIRHRTEHLAAMLGEQHGLTDADADTDAAAAADALTRWIFDLPTCVVASLLGVGQAELPSVAQSTAHFVRCLSPLSTPEQLLDASAAAQALNACFARLVRAGTMAPESLLAGVVRQAARAGWADQDAMLANLVGLLSQTHEATAGLIGNTFIALIEKPQLAARLRADPGLAEALVMETARRDPPIQNTRRFVVEPTSVAGVALQPGDTILLLVAAAGRDELIYSRPDALVLERARRPLPGFGHGRHACPGQDLACAIAATAIRHLLALPAGFDPAALGWVYRRSLNARLPEFFNATAKRQP